MTEAQEKWDTGHETFGKKGGHLTGDTGKRGYLTGDTGKGEYLTRDSQEHCIPDPRHWRKGMFDTRDSRRKKGDT